MVVVDTSALVAIALKEPERERFVSLMSEGAIVGTPILVETAMVLRPRAPASADAFMDGLLGSGLVSVEPFTAGMYLAAREAFGRYGRGSGHAARLNFCDCLSYAVAKVLARPLLFKGEDFSRTDILPALPR